MVLASISLTGTDDFTLDFVCGGSDMTSCFPQLGLELGGYFAHECS